MVNLTDRESLTFYEISRAWFEELKNTNDAQDFDTILTILIRAFWHGDFEDEAGQSCLLWRQDRLNEAWAASRESHYGMILTGERWVPPSVAEGTKPDYSAMASLASSDYHNTQYREHCLDSLEIRRNDFSHWVRSIDRELPYFWFGDLPGVAAPTKIGAKRGRPPVIDWDMFWVEVVRIANTIDGLPKRQADLEKTMLEWCLRIWGKEPSVSSVRKRLTRLYPNSAED